MVEELNFDDISLKEIPVSIERKKYVLREATGDTACRYRNAVLHCTELGPEGSPATIKGLADVEPFLVSLCLFETCLDERGNPTSERSVPVSVIRKWPSRVQKALFERAKEISELSEEEEDLESLTKKRKEVNEKIVKLQEDSAKKEPSNTAVGFD